MPKIVKLKCGHSVNVQGFKPSKTERGNWVFEGWEPTCGRIVKVGVKFAAPSDAMLGRWISSGICKTLDSCKVEPDGECQHGFPSWLRALNLI